VPSGPYAKPHEFNAIGRIAVCGISGNCQQNAPLGGLYRAFYLNAATNGKAGRNSHLRIRLPAGAVSVTYDTPSQSLYRRRHVRELWPQQSREALCENRKEKRTVGMKDVPLAGAFLAGLISFLSPCVLPLVPGYISMLSGISVEQLRQGQQPKSGLFASALSFVIGFSVVFVAFGASASAVGGFLQAHKNLLAPVAGALILLFGLHLLGGLIKMNVRAGIILGGVLVVLGIASLLRGGPLFAGLGAMHFFSLSIIGFFGPVLARWLNQDVRLRSTDTKPGMLSGFLLGFAFAFGWTPCIGPILSAVLVLAAASGTLARGVLLLAVYAAGLAVPFLLTAVLLNQFLRFYQNFRRHLHAVEVFSGALLLFVGGLVFFNKLAWLAGKLTFLNRFTL